jgi:hypothetical protein
MKRPGRPPLDPDDVSMKVTITLPTRRFDQLCKAAQEEHASVPELIRRLIDRAANKDITK